MDKQYIDKMMAQFIRKCSKEKLKITPQRVAIYSELLRAKNHPSADDIYKEVKKSLPHISFDTVYRTLFFFSEMGLLDVVEGYGEKKRFEPDLNSHHHLRCIKCHKIIDFRNSSYDSIDVPPEILKDFRVTNKRVVLEGICKDCSKQ